MASKIEMGWEVIDGEVRIFTSLHCRRYQWRSEKTGATVIFYYGIHRKTVKRFNPLQGVSVSRQKGGKNGFCSLFQSPAGGVCFQTN